jgi:hypothetical protein
MTTTTAPDKALLQKAIDAIMAFKTREEIEAAGFVPGWAQAGSTVEPQVGELAVVWGHNGWRRAVITKVTADTVHVLFSTPGAFTTGTRVRHTTSMQNPLAVRGHVYRQELKNWDFYQQQVNAGRDKYTSEAAFRLYEAAVAEGRELYAARKADEAADKTQREAQFARTSDLTHWVNVAKGKGDRTGRKGTNLYIQGR